MMHSIRSVAMGMGMIVALAFARPAHAEDCIAAARADAARQPVKVARVYYWTGALSCIVDCTAPPPAGAHVIVYFPAGKQSTTDDQLGAKDLVRDADASDDHTPVAPLTNCPTLFSRRFVVRAPETAAPRPPDPCDATPFQPDCVVKRYLRPSGDKRFLATGNTESIATEAVQVLGQIVADRASQAAYVLLQDRLIEQLKCPKEKTEGEPPGGSDKAKANSASADLAATGISGSEPTGNTATNATIRFPATCRVIASLRLQDIAMSPAELRAALVQDVLGWLAPAKPSTDPPPPTSHVSAVAAIARIRETPAPGSAPATAAVASGGPVLALPAAAVNPAPQPKPDLLVPNPYDSLRDGLERRLIPLLTRSVERITGHAAETEVRSMVDSKLRELEKPGAANYCALKDRERVGAAAALGFAWCVANADANRTDAAKCAVMQVVPMFEDPCRTSPPPETLLTEAQLSYAESIAGHLLDAYTLKKDSSTPDAQGRLVAAAAATFEIACMYAAGVGDGKLAGYHCDVDDSKHGGKLGQPEIVALARDLVLAALDRNGTGLATVVIRGLQRILPDPSKHDEVKGIRTLASIAAYAATYVSTASPEDAHKQRTALLESLTRDMTVRTDRGGEVIFGLGGALRFVAGGRIGRSVAGTRPTAFASPASLTLGFGLDYLFKDSRNGIHIETGVLDLGQYLAFDEGVKVATPDLAAAVSPSLTIGYFWHRELPIFLGATVGYTPSYDFTSDGSKPKGAFNAGLTLGVYVPLFDFN